jgi:PAS domain S-box-containing protein
VSGPATPREERWAPKSVDIPAPLARRSVVTRLVAAFLVLSVISVAVVATVGFVHARGALERAAFERLAAVAAAREDELDRWVEQQRADIAFLAQLPAVRSGAERLLSAPAGDPALQSELRAFLHSTVQRGTGLSDVFLLSDIGGRVVVSTTPGDEGTFRVASLYFLEGRKGVFVQNVYPSSVTGRPTLTIAAPVFGAGGQRTGVLAAHLDLRYMDRILSERSGLGETGEAYLIDRFNMFVSAEHFGRDEFRRGAHSSAINAAVAGADGAGRYVNYAGVPVIGIWRWLERHQLALLTEMSQEEAFAPARRLALVILLLGAASTLILAGAAYLLARQIARPIRVLTEAVARVADGHLGGSVPVVTNDEIGILAGAFNTMTGQLRALYRGLGLKVEEAEHAAQALRESKQLLQAIIDNTTAIVFVKDREGRYLLVNRAFEKLIRRPREKILGRTITDLLPVEIADAIRVHDRRVFETAQPLENEETVAFDDEQRTFLALRFPLRDADSPPYALCGILTEITERKHAEDERRRLEAQVLHAQKLESLGVLAGGIAHDFNNLLVAVLGNAELALIEAGTDASVRESLEQIRLAARRAAELTQQMLAYSGKAAFVVQPIDLNEVVREMVPLLEVSISKKAKLHFELAADLPAVSGDATQLRQVVMNLITNASEAIAPQAGEIRISTGVVDADAAYLAEPHTEGSLEAGQYVYLEVQDTGVGMDAETIGRIFEPFFTTKFTGRGLGLASLLGIVRGHQGIVKVRSRAAGGTTFRVHFPLPPQPVAASAPVATPAPAAVQWEKASGTVLVADDEESVRRFATRVLERAGYDVLAAGDGAEAVEVFGAHADRIGVVLLDMMMPRLSGEEVLREIRLVRPDVRVVLTSGYSDQDVGGTAADAFLQKPYAPQELVRVIREARTALPAE